MINQEQNKRLGIKDFSLMGIFSAIMFALAMILMFITGITPAVYIFYPTIFALTCGPLFMVIIVKVQKFGAFFIPSVIIGILLGLMGAQTLLITSVVFGFIAEVIARSGRYKDYKRIAIAYIVLMFGFYVGDIAPVYVFTDWYIKQATGGVAGADMTYLNSLIDVAKSWLGLVSIISCLIAAFLGTVIGKRILKKHFEKAGMI
ncbi:MptD family putative ECF transporter S component [Tissierella praeacuta]|uniref:MptD family putative ECF transporter S component n=1 Tax=Tissierella praeacuta TaxID=43131 RepID=UPI002FD9A3FA